MAPLLIETFESERDRGLSLSVLADFSKDLSLFLSLSLSLFKKNLFSPLLSQSVSPSSCLPRSASQRAKDRKKKEELKKHKARTFLLHSCVSHTYTHEFYTKHTARSVRTGAASSSWDLNHKGARFAVFFLNVRARARGLREKIASRGSATNRNVRERERSRALSLRSG